MSDSKNLKKIASLAAIVLCLAFAAILAFTFAACDDIDALSATNPGDENMSPDDIIVENPNAVITKDFDENGVAECMYYFDYDGHCYNCDMGECEGHEYYLTKGGGAYSFYPICHTMTFKDENGSTGINSEIRVSIVIDSTEMDRAGYDWANEGNVFGDYYFGAAYGGAYIEISSLTGEPLSEKLEFNHVADQPVTKLERYSYYEASMWGDYTEYRSEEPTWAGELSIDPRLVYTELTQTYRLYTTPGAHRLYLYATDGSVYTCDFWGINALAMIDAEVVYV